MLPQLSVLAAASSGAAAGPDQALLVDGSAIVEPAVKDGAADGAAANGGGGGAADEASGEPPKRAASKLPWRENPLVTKGPWILVQEMCERLAYNGIACNIITYMKDELGMSSSSSASMTQLWSGTCYLTPLLGAFLADAYFGRFKVIVGFSVCFYLVGLVLLTISAALPGLKPQPGQDASSSSLGVFWAGMYLVALGEGGIKPNVTPLGADQFDETDPRQAKRIPSFFSWCYACINLGTFITLTVVVNIQTSVSWAAGFAVILAAFVIATTVFIAGSLIVGYRQWPPGGSPITRMLRVAAAAVAHRKAQVPADTCELHEVPGDMSVVPGQVKLPRTASFKCLEKAAVRTQPAGAKERWLVTLTEVEELKCVLRLIPVAATLITFYAIYGQTTTLFILQGQGMDTSLGSLNLAPATVGAIDPVAVVVGVCIYELAIVPWFAKIGHPITTLRRIGAGYVFSMLGMVAAAVVEIMRLRVVDRHGLTDLDPTADGSPEVPMSVWWQAPQYVFIGVSELLAVAGSLELFYSQAPDAMRSFCAALQVVCMGLGSYVAAALVAILQAISTSDGGPGWVADNVNQGHLDYFFWTLLVLMFINSLMFLFIAGRFRYRVLPHATTGVELATGDTNSTALGLSPTLSRRLNTDLRAGLLRQDTLHRELTAGRLSGKSSMVLRRAVEQSRRSLSYDTGAGGSHRGDLSATSTKPGLQTGMV